MTTMTMTAVPTMTAMTTMTTMTAMTAMTSEGGERSRMPIPYRKSVIKGTTARTLLVLQR